MSPLGYPAKRFLGARTRESAKNEVSLGEFAFFYAMPDVVGDILASGRDLPHHVHLLCIYQSTFAQYHYFPVVRTKWGWKVDTGDDSVNGFSSLTQLIRHHEIHSYLCIETRALETFPVFPNQARVEGPPNRH